MCSLLVLHEQIQVRDSESCYYWLHQGKWTTPIYLTSGIKLLFCYLFRMIVFGTRHKQCFVLDRKLRSILFYYFKLLATFDIFYSRDAILVQFVKLPFIDKLLLHILLWEDNSLYSNLLSVLMAVWLEIRWINKTWQWCNNLIIVAILRRVPL